MAEANKNIRSLKVVKPPKNLGVAPSWNTIIHMNQDAPYWMICANDMMPRAESPLEYDILFGDGYSWFIMILGGLSLDE